MYVVTARVRYLEGTQGRGVQTAASKDTNLV